MGIPKYNINKVRILSCDAALNHSGFTFTIGGKYKSYYQIVPEENKTKTIAGVKSKKYDTDTYGMVRLSEHIRSFKKVLLITKPDFFTIEGYSYSSKGSSMYQIGELGGSYRVICYMNHIPIRIHDPLSIKLMATGNGHAKKEQMLETCEIDFLELIHRGRGKITKKKIEQIEDLADAYHLNQLLYKELQLRKGVIRLQDLPDHQISVFNRVTKAFPINILSNNFIWNPK